MLDTRHATAGALAKAVTRNVYVAGAAGFKAQGGAAAGCGVPVGATAVTATLATVTPKAGGYLVAWAAGSAKPSTAALYFGAHATTSTGATLPLARTTGRASLQVSAAGGVRVVMDVTGYYTLPMAVTVNTDGTIMNGGARVTAVTAPADVSGSYSVRFDRDVSSCVYSATPFSFHLTAQAAPRSGDPDAVYVLLQNASDTDTAGAFNLVVTC